MFLLIARSFSINLGTVWSQILFLLAVVTSPSRPISRSPTSSSPSLLLPNLRWLPARALRARRLLPALRLPLAAEHGAVASFARGKALSIVAHGRRTGRAHGRRTESRRGGGRLPPTSPRCRLRLRRRSRAARRAVRGRRRRTPLPDAGCNAQKR